MAVRPTYRLRVSTRYRASAEQVWAHGTDVDALIDEFPLWAPFRFTRSADVRRALEDGALQARIPARIGVFPWTAEVCLTDPGRCFTARGESSLFSLFVHTHTVEPVSDGARRLDDVWFAPASAPAFVARWTARLFQARHRRAARVLPADTQSVGQTVLRNVLEDEDIPTILA